MSYHFYDLTDEEITRVRLTNEHSKAYVCSCGIQDTKPSFCSQGPIVNSLVPECGYKFERVNGKVERSGKCNRCGRCCAMLRKDGDPFGFYAPPPEGKPCQHLIVEEL